MRPICWPLTLSASSRTIRVSRPSVVSLPVGTYRTCRRDSARGQPEAGPQERLSRSGDNLANVIQYLAEQHQDRLEQIFSVLRDRVPHVERVLADTMPDGRLLLQIKDAPFSHPVMARFASDGTLKMLAYLVLLYDPEYYGAMNKGTRAVSGRPTDVACPNSPRKVLCWEISGWRGTSGWAIRW